MREYIGLEHDLQGTWREPFCFVNLSFTSRLKTWTEDMNASGENVARTMKETVSSVNRLRPRVCVVNADFASALTSQTTVDEFRKQISRISESIPLIFVAAIPSSQRREYTTSFGADFYGFWYGGMRGLVLNTALIVDESTDPDCSRAQEEWFDGEVEQGQLGGHHLCVFTHHMWYINDAYEDQLSELTIPKPARLRWLRKMQNGKVRALFEGSSSKNIVRRLKATTIPSEQESKVGDEGDVSENDTSEDEGYGASAVEINDVEVVSTSDFSSTDDIVAAGLRIVTVFEESLKHDYYELGKVSVMTLYV